MNPLSQKELEKYASVLLWAVKKAKHSPFKKYDSVLLRYDALSEPLALEVYKLLLKEKFNVVARTAMSENFAREFYILSDDKQLKFNAAGERAFNTGLNALIAIRAPQDLTYLKNTDPSRLALAAKARKPIRKILDDREQQGAFGWTLCNYPTPASAAHARLSLKEYAEQIKKACFLDDKDPIRKWEEVDRHTREICSWLTKLKMDTLHLDSKNCSLNLSLGESRIFLGGRGCNIPSFEIFTSPDCRRADGVYFADMPSYRSGVLCKDIRLEFKDGRVIKSSAKEGANFVKKMLAMDAGASRLGEFSLTDRRFSKIDRFMADTLFDENFGGKHGNSHIALGQSFADAYSGNQKTFGAAQKKALGFNESSLHWDIINTEDKTVHAKLKNGKKILIYERGIFKL